MKRLILILAALVFASGLFAEKVELTWNDNSDNETGFEMERKTRDGEFVVIGTTNEDEAVYVDETVEPGNTYTYRVRAFNFDGYSGYSNEVATEVKQSKYFEPFEADEAPGLLQARQIVDTVIINAENVIINENE